MQSSGPDQNAHITISEEDAHKFLERLATDDDFRAELERDPGKVLREHGIKLEAADVPDSVSLPPKSEIAEFVDSHRRTRAARRNVLGFAILYWVLGAMPLVIAEDDGTG